jgi:Amiloride-sensitive sodium channel
MYIHFASNFFLPHVKVESFPFSSFLSNVGGFMGLLAGVSVLSIVEVFYHVVIQFGSNHQKVHPLVQANEPRRIARANEDHALYKFSQYLFEFIRSSSMHGLHYTQDRSQNKCGKIFWSLLVSLSIAICSVLIVDIYKHAEKSPVTTSIDSQLLTLDDVSNLPKNQVQIVQTERKRFQIPFPSIVICADVDLDKYFIYKRCFFDAICENVTLDEA